MIHLEGDWYIDLDPYCYVLQKFMGTDKKGNSVYRYQTYHGSLERAVKEYVNLAPFRVLTDKDMEFADAVKEIRKEYDRLSDLVERTLKYDSKQG